MKRYKVRYGSQVIIRDLPDHTTIGDIKESLELRATLGYGDNVNALYQGATLPDGAMAPEFVDSPQSMSNPFYGAIVIETACNKKELALA